MTEALQQLTASPDCSAMQRFEAAKLYAVAGATADAITAYREAGAAFIDPEGDTGRAREAYGEAHALDQQNLDIVFELGRVDMIEGHPRAALAKFTQILSKSNQAYVPALFESACIHQELGQHDQAVLTFRKVLDRDKTNVQAIVSMGQRLQSMGMVPEAVGYFIQAASAAQAAGQLGTCRHVINMAVYLDPNNQQARRILAELEELPDPNDVRPEELMPHIRRRDQQPVREVTAPAAAPANSALAAEVDDLTARIDRMQRKISALTGVVAELEETVATLKTEVGDRMQRKLSAVTGVVSGFEETVAILKAEIAELKLKAPARITKIVDVKPSRAKAAAKTSDATANASVKKTPAAAKSKSSERAPAKAPTPRR